MSKSVEEAIEWIHSRLPFGMKPGLTRVEALLERVGNPEKQVSTIHIAGTNGKGSTVTDLRCMLEELGLQVGTFTSPYIEHFNERIAINGESINNQELVDYVEKYQKIVLEMDQETALSGITEFETLTAMAFDYFLNKKVDVAIIEVGLGGLLDSTNVVSPMLTAVTTIGKDHMDILGDTLMEIAEQKAGIIKPDIPVVTGNIGEEALAVIEKTAKEKNGSIYRFGKEYQAEYIRPDNQWGEIFHFYNEAGKLTNVKVSLLGRHQVENASVAIQLFYLYCQMNGIPFAEKNVYNGLAIANWPARMERISQEPLVVLDGAHNEHAIAQLVENLRKEFSQREIIILFSALSTKEVDTMIKELKKIPRVQLYLTTFDYPKAVDLKMLEHWEDETTEIVSLWQFGLGEILEKMSSEDMLLITGSLYFVSQVRELLMELGGNDD